MTVDDTPETLLLSLREDAYRFIPKPIQPGQLLELIRTTLDDTTALPSSIVVSARPGWVELIVPCARTVADRIEGFVANLDADLPPDVRTAVGIVFRELLLDAMEGDGQFDANRRVRIAYLRSSRMLLYRIADAGYGFRAGDVTGGDAVSRSNGGGRAMRVNRPLLRPGFALARQLADELLVNEARTEVVFVKYLD
jgi:hypothetical protein